MWKKVDANSYHAKAFQTLETLLYTEYADQISLNQEALEETRALMEYHEHCRDTNSVSELLKYTDTMLEKCRRKQQEIERIKQKMKSSSSLAVDTEKELTELISQIIQNSMVGGRRMTIGVSFKSPLLLNGFSLFFSPHQVWDLFCFAPPPPPA